MIKLIFIGDKDNVSNFEYQGLTFRPYYMFAERYSLNDISPYLKSSNIKNFKLSDFMNASQKVGNKPVSIYACLTEGENGFYMPSSQDQLNRIDVSKINDTKFVEEVEQPKIISNEYIIATKNEIIAQMMKYRGCKILKQNDLFLIVEEQTLKYIKQFRDNIKWSIKGSNKIKTKTGYEENIIATFNGQSCKGYKVHSFRNNKTYIIVNDSKNNETLFSEIWYDSEGKIENTPKHQSNRVYTWKVS